MNVGQVSLVTHVCGEVARVGACSAFQNLLAANDAAILRPELETGRAIVAARSAVYAGLVRHWAEKQRTSYGYARPFAVVALGATGRAEMVPYSDCDFAFLFDDSIEGNDFLRELQRQVLHSPEFENHYGFSFQPLPFNLDDAGHLEGKQLNSFLDMEPVYDPEGLAQRFRERIRMTFDPFEHFLHVRRFWKEQWEKAAGESERLDRFDIKNEGLRVFLAGIWTLAGRNFLHSREVYATLQDQRDLAAYDFLLRVRAFVHLRRRQTVRGGRKNSASVDVLSFEDFISFGDMLGPDATEKERFEFANEARARLLSARRRVAQFTKGVVEHTLRQGLAISPGNAIVCGVGGLYHREFAEHHTPKEKSKAALSLLLAAQKYGVPVDPAEMQVTFRGISDWLVRVPELSALFYESRGSLADSFNFLSQFDDAEERLFPGYAKFESSLDARVMAERTSLRSSLERRKIRAFEDLVRAGRDMLARAVSTEATTDVARSVSVPVEAALLSLDHLAAVKLALKTKRLPLTADDLLIREDQRRPLFERFSTGFSNVPLSEYFRPFREECGFSPETLRTAEFLIANRRAFKDWAQTPINDSTRVEEFARLCRDPQLLRALFVFTSADRSEWGSDKQDPARWFNTRELYRKTMTHFRPGADPVRSLETMGFTPDQLAILKDFGADFFGGVYRQYAARFGEHLVSLHAQPEATGVKVAILREGTSTIIGVAARDYRGLAASITGALWHQSIPVSMAHLFSASTHGLILDFFHVGPEANSAGSGAIRRVDEAVQHRLHIGEADESIVPSLSGVASLQPWRPGQFCLRFESPQEPPGLLYAVTYRVFRYLGGSIFGLSCQPAGRGAYVDVFLSLPNELSLERARQIVAARF